MIVKKMKKYFLAGLITLLPFTLTVILLLFLINLLTNPFEGTVEGLLQQYPSFNKSYSFFSAHQVQHLSSIFLVLFFLLTVTFLIGFLGRLVLLKTIFRFGNRALHHIPIINKIYKTFQDAVGTALDSEKKTFSQVVLVPFPNSKIYSIGLIAKKQSHNPSNDSISVFIPGTPNPTGLMVIYKKKEVIFIDMKVEEALKFVVSCGIMFPGFRP